MVEQKVVAKCSENSIDHSNKERCESTEFKRRSMKSLSLENSFRSSVRSNQSKRSN